ncbi:chemotaxis-specific protein-glutamate methyltransferase CheB [Lysobacter terrae]
MKIAIVNDLALAVEALRRALAQRPRHSVAWTAADGVEAVERCAKDPPDLILMDLLMPRMDGVEATRRIMAKHPCPILVVTVSVGGNAPLVFEAMGHGALDAVDLPALGVDDDPGVEALLAKIDLIERLVGANAVRTIARPAPRRRSTMPLIAVGASAGGPAALARMLADVPASLPAAMVIVQHIDEKFAASMADWLGRYAHMPVHVARAGERPQPGTILLAGTNEHLIMRADSTLQYTQEPADLSYRPSVDVFFNSANDAWEGPIVGVLLTGMGRDGALGLRALRERGHHTIAQDKATSAVYGMPKAAAELNAAVDILPLDRIGPRLRAILDTRSAVQ